jgi:hypothetical protein
LTGWRATLRHADAFAAAGIKLRDVFACLIPWKAARALGVMAANAGRFMGAWAGGRQACLCRSFCRGGTKPRDVFVISSPGQTPRSGRWRCKRADSWQLAQAGGQQAGQVFGDQARPEA